MIDFIRRLLCIGTLIFLPGVQTTQPQSATKPGQPLALANVTVIDGEGGTPKPGMTIVISGDRITDIFRTGSGKPPAEAQVYDLSNHYVIPGLIDSHYHFTLGMRSKEEEAALRRFAFLGGITSVRDMAGDAIALAELAKLAADGDVQSPRVYFSALMAGLGHLQGDKRADGVSRGRPRGEVPWAKGITPETDIARAVSEAKATGATGIKIYTDLPQETVVRLIAEAHRQGLKVWSHAAIYPGKPSDAVRAGVDVISHSNLAIVEAMEKVPERYSGSYPLLDYNSYGVESKAISELLKLMLDRGTVLDPTLVVTERLGKTEPGKIFRDPVRMAEWTYQFTMRAHIRRIPMVVGTDVNESPGTREFPNIHTEMEMMVSRAGMTPLEAITAATRNGAQVLGVSSSFGTIARGKVADMVILSADPSTDIRNTTSIVYVIKGGKLHKRDGAGERKSSDETATAQELRNLVRRWDEATVKGDAATLDYLLADEFTFVGGPNKAQYLAFIKSRSADTVVESAVSEDVQVQIYGDTAIVVAVDRIKGKKKGQAYEESWLYLDVWVKRSGRWQCVKTYSTLRKQD